MAAITQTDADKAGISPVRVKVTGVTNDVYGIKFASIYFIVGDGDPNGELTAPIGSVFFRKTAAAGNIYKNTDGATAWAVPS